jgi:predicted glycosyltransferase
MGVQVGPHGGHLSLRRFSLRIWIDFSNSPHPLLFGPVISRLHSDGHEVLITARDNAQTVELARRRWPEVVVIGGPSPKGRRAKAKAIADRVLALRRWAKAERPALALSHNSYSQVVAARLTGIPSVTAMDFEHQPANHLAFRLATAVLLPEALRATGVRSQGAAPGKTRFYPGLKEELYLADFEPDAQILERIGITRDPGTALVVARPAPDLATYHQFENPLFLECVKSVLRDPRAVVVALPRHDAQRHALRELGGGRCIVPERAVDSRSLMTQADLLIGAGGTMTREAALMGVRTVSLFAGRQPAVDRWLVENGMMQVLTSVDELPSMEAQPRADRLVQLRERGDVLVEHFCDVLMETAGTGACARREVPA